MSILFGKRFQTHDDEDEDHDVVEQFDDEEEDDEEDQEYFGAPSLSGIAGVVAGTASGLVKGSLQNAQYLAGKGADVLHTASGRGSNVTTITSSIIAKETDLKTDLVSLKQNINALKSQHGSASSTNATDLAFTLKKLEETERKKTALQNDLDVKIAKVSELEKAKNEMTAELEKEKREHASTGLKTSALLALKEKEFAALNLKEQNEAAEIANLKEKERELQASQKTCTDNEVQTSRELAEIQKLIDEINPLVAELKNSTAAVHVDKD